MQKAHPVLVEDGYSLDDVEQAQFLVSCPACPTQAIGDSAMTHAQPGGDSFKHDDNRLSYRIPFECENGHAFWFKIRQHKGNTYLETEFRGLTDQPELICGGCSQVCDDCPALADPATGSR